MIQVRFPIDTAKLTLRVTSPPREDRDYSTGEVKQRDSKPLFVVECTAMDGTESERIRIRVAGQPACQLDDKVRATGLSCLFWTLQDRSGLSFAADALEVVTPARGESANAGRGESAKS